MQLQVLQDEEDAQLLREERKKNKIKFAPIPDIPVSSEPLILPLLVTIRKLKSHQFCELWHFTNMGLDKEDHTSSFAIDNNSLSIIPAADSSHAFVPSAFTWDKSVANKDEDIIFEQFGQAMVCMVKAMIDCGWQKPHIDMHIKFWLHIEIHEWHYLHIQSEQ